MEEPPSSGKLTDADLQEFIVLFKKEFKKKLSLEEAREMATSMMTLYSLLYLEKPDRQPAKESFEPTPQLAPGAARKVRTPTPLSPRLDDIRGPERPMI